MRSFDAVASVYAREFRDELDRKPFDRDLLDRVANECPPGLIVDVDCGAAGQIGAYVARRGRQVTGLDASTVSVAVAQSLEPDMSFVAGDLRALPLRDGAVAGVTVFYCLIYGSADELERELRELHRVLQPGGMLVAAVHAGTGAEHFDDFRGIPVDATIVLREPDELAAAVGSAGFSVGDVTVRSPYPDEHHWDRLYLVATA